MALLDDQDDLKSKLKKKYKQDVDDLIKNSKEFRDSYASNMTIVI